MLAGARTTKKYSIDPRGGVWANDETKFGHKLMEKMGWSKGQGLGAELTGDPHHVLIRRKIDNKGIGCSHKHVDNWIAHQDDFNSLLEGLKTDHATDDTATTSTSATATAATGDVSDDSSSTQKAKHSSLDDQAKSRKNRMHYHKFTRGKDLSRFNADDIDNIMGKRMKSSKAQKQEEENKLREGSLTKLHGVETSTSSSNIHEYFANKMKAKLNRSKGGEPEQPVSDKVEEEEADDSDGIIRMRMDEAVVEDEEDAAPRKKRKRKLSEVDSDAEVKKSSKKSKKAKKSKKKAKVVAEEEEIEEEVVVKKKKSKKSKKSKKNKHE